MEVLFQGKGEDELSTIAIPGERAGEAAAAREKANPGELDSTDIDDGGEGFNSRVTVEAPIEGIYTVVCTSAVAGQTGSYELDVTTYGLQEWTEGGGPNETYAVLVGAGDYPIGTDGDLKGTTNDVTRMQQLLTEDFGVPAENVVTLLDGRASRRNLIDGFRRHLAQAGPNGTAIFYYTGHGTRIEDVAAADEEDGFDDALYLVDDELGVLIDELAADRVLVIFDSCFSGTGTRLVGDVRTKGLDYEDVQAWLRAPAGYVATSGAASFGGADAPADHVLLASSREIEPSLDIDGLAEMGGPGGLFTYHLIKAIRAMPAESTFVELLDETKALMEPVLTQIGSVQIPQVAGQRAGESMRGYLNLGS